MESAKDVGKNVEVNEYQEALNKVLEIATYGEVMNKEYNSIFHSNVKKLQELVDKEPNTCMGYKVEDLIVVAKLIQNYNIDVEVLTKNLESMRFGYKACIEEYEKAMKETIRRFTRNE